MKALWIVTVCVLLSACGPSCEQQGGHLETTGNVIIIPQLIGKILVPMVYPETRCVFGTEAQQ